ncbi:MAG TPA: FixH family protein [Candidatus Eisenbacteria bacterium]|jgi:hypothetical protein
MNPGRLWPIAIVGVLAITVGANVWLLYEAHRDPNASALESDYYRKAVAYDSTLAQARRDSVLGWRLEVTPGAYDPAGTRFAVALTDRDGRAISGARIALAAIHNLDAGRERTATFLTGADGRATSTVSLRHTGLWELRFEVRHEAERFTCDLRRDIGRPAP